MNRKDQHVSLAKAFYHTKTENDFDQLRFVHHSLQNIDAKEIDLATEFSGLKLSVPFYINAMTGGSPKTKEINRDLASIARQTGLMMATGSSSAALKDPSVADSFAVVRQENPNGLILANLGAGRKFPDAKKVIDLLKADGFQIHLNIPQEVVMPEGDLDFHEWHENIQGILTNISLPVIVKEVGFGMSRETIQQLIALGAQNIDISGTGGTSFSQIENARRKKREFGYLEDWGQSTVISLLESQPYQEQVTILASGGIRNAYDIFKALSLGAKAVGVSATILNQLMAKGVAATVELIESWKQELAALYLLTGKTKTSDLKKNPLIITGYPKEYSELRGLDLKKYAQR